MTTELSIAGVLPSTLYNIVAERLSGFCERGEAFISSEEIFTRNATSQASDGPGTGGSSAGGPSLRVKATRTRSRGEASWSIQINGRPEPARTAPRAQQYGVTEFAIEDGSDPREFASALGYRTSLFTVRRRGVRFQRGKVTVELFQLYELDDLDGPPLDESSYAVSVSTRFTAAPTSITSSSSASSATTTAAPAAASAANGTGSKGSTAQGGQSQEVREASIAALEDVARLLRGLVVLHRVD